MSLPGGVIHDGVRRRDFAFRAITGHVEFALAEIAAGSAPARVTAALSAALQHAGGEPPTPDNVSRLSVADRQYLMGRLAAELGCAEQWYTVQCRNCREAFDVQVDHAALPAKEAGRGYPFAFADTAAGRRRFRIPSGQDQEAIADVEDDTDAAQALARLCFADSDRAAPEFSAVDVAAIETALEAVAAEVATAVQAACPACGGRHTLDVDPYIALDAGTGERLFEEIHVLASAYHWSESEILALPQERRRRYLQLIGKAQGLAG